MARTHTVRYAVGDHVRCYREAPEGATGVVVKVNPRSTSPYKVRWDEPNPFTGVQGETWVSRVVVMHRTTCRCGEWEYEEYGEVCPSCNVEAS